MVKALREAGLHVTDIHEVGKGVPDLLVTKGARMLLVEVKDKNGRLTPHEVEWHADFPEDGPLIVATVAEDVLRWFRII